MIDRIYGQIFTICCDVCGEEAPERFMTFEGAVDYKRENGWRSQKTDRGWEDVCPACQEPDRYF